MGEKGEDGDNSSDCDSNSNPPSPTTSTAEGTTTKEQPSPKESKTIQLQPGQVSSFQILSDVTNVDWQNLHVWHVSSEKLTLPVWPPAGTSRERLSCTNGDDRRREAGPGNSGYLRQHDGETAKETQARDTLPSLRHGLQLWGTTRINAVIPRLKRPTPFPTPTSLDVFLCRSTKCYQLCNWVSNTSTPPPPPGISALGRSHRPLQTFPKLKFVQFEPHWDNTSMVLFGMILVQQELVLVAFDGIVPSNVPVTPTILLSWVFYLLCFVVVRIICQCNKKKACCQSVFCLLSRSQWQTSPFLLVWGSASWSVVLMQELHVTNSQWVSIFHHRNDQWPKENFSESLPIFGVSLPWQEKALAEILLL